MELLIAVILFGLVVGLISYTYIDHLTISSVMSYIFLGLLGSIIGVLYGQLILGDGAGKLRVGVGLVSLFCALLLLYVGKIIEKSKG